MIVRGVCTRLSWERARDSLLTKPEEVLPLIELADLKTREVRLVEIPLGSRVRVRAGHASYCTFRKLDGSYCLNMIQKRAGRIPICGRCALDMPSLRCMLGEPQCRESEAPKSAKCVKSGLYQTRCTAPRFHYVLVYPESSSSAFLKVGIQREATFPTRILEQAALVSVVYARTPNVWRGREVEVLSAAYLEELEGRVLGGVKVAHASERKKAASRVAQLLSFIRSSATTLDAFFGRPAPSSAEAFASLGRAVGEFLSRRFEEYSLKAPIVVNDLEVYPYDEELVARAESVSHLTSGVSEVSGILAGWLGSFMLLARGGGLAVMDLRGFVGRQLELEADEAEVYALDVKRT